MQHLARPSPATQTSRHAQGKPLPQYHAASTRPPPTPSRTGGPPDVLHRQTIRLVRVSRAHTSRCSQRARSAFPVLLKAGRHQHRAHCT
eukprot:scaffold23661_cov113-Isochrysis_galbana.AAC.7